MQISNSPEFDLIQISSIQNRTTQFGAPPAIDKYEALFRGTSWLLQGTEGRNELRLSQTLPLGPRVISRSNVTFVESVMCACERLRVCVIVAFVCVCARCFYKQRDKAEVTWGLLWGLSSLPFINAGGHSSHTLGHLLPAMNSKNKLTDQITET